MTYAQLQAAKDKAGEASKKMRALTDEMHKRESKSFEGDEEKQYNSWEQDYDNAMAEYARVERQMQREKELVGISGNSNSLIVPGADPEKETNSQAGDNKEYRAAFKKFVEYGIDGLTEKEKRAVSVLPAAQGGILIPPKEVSGRLIKGIDDLVLLRQYATVSQLPDAESLNIPSMVSDVGSASWGSETSTITEKSTPTFGKRSFSPHELNMLIKLSLKILRIKPDLEGFVETRMKRGFAVAEEQAFMTGNGVNQPLGLFTASNDGIPTSRDVVGSNTTTALHPDTLFDVVYGLKSGYTVNARWLLHRLVVKAIRKLKDSQNQYLWVAGIAGGAPATICDYPYIVSEYAPSTFTASSYIGLFGDLSNYEIVEGQDIQMQRLNELYALNSQVGIIGRQAVDGAPVQGEAFIRMQMAAS